MKSVDKERFGPWAVVTGASSGIGKEFARQLAASGLNLVLVARRESLLTELGLSLARQYHIEFRTLGSDLSDEGSLESIEVATRDLDVGLLVSNAGAGRPGDFLSLAKKELLHSVQLNALSHLHLAHHFGGRLTQRGYGGVLLVSAMGAADGIPYMAVDAASKALALSLGRAIHHEFKKFGVNVTVLLPTAVETPVLDKLGFDGIKLPAKPFSVERCVDEGLASLVANRPSRLVGRRFRIIDALVPTSMKTAINGTMLAKVLAARSRKRPETSS